MTYRRKRLGRKSGRRAKRRRGRSYSGMRKGWKRQRGLSSRRNLFGGQRYQSAATVFVPTVRMPRHASMLYKTCFFGECTPDTGAGQYNDTLFICDGNSALTPWDNSARCNSSLTNGSRAKWMAFYDNELINKCSIKGRIINNGTANRMICVIPLRTSTPLANTLKLEDVCDYPRLKKYFLGGAASTTNYKSQVIIKYSTTTKSMFSRRNLQNDEFWGTVSARPTEDWYIHVLSFQFDNSVETVATLDFQLESYHHAHLKNRDQ